MTAEQLKIVAVIPARAGSKGVPKKNLRQFLGAPLIAHTIKAALQADRIDRVIVSTDDPAIAGVSKQSGAEVIWRPEEISDDSAPSESALLHVINSLQQIEGYIPDLIVFLQCTSPVRQARDIDQAIQLVLDEESDSLLSVVPFHLFIWRLADGQAQAIDYDYSHRPRRQDRPPEYVENGSIYVFKPWVLRRLNNRLGGKISLYVMDERSIVDINTVWDFELGEWVCSRLSRRGSCAKE